MQPSSNSPVVNGNSPRSSDIDRARETILRMDEMELTDFLLETVDQDKLNRIATRIMAHAHSISLQEAASPTRSAPPKKRFSGHRDSHVLSRQKIPLKSTPRAAPAVKRPRATSIGNGEPPNAKKPSGTTTTRFVVPINANAKKSPNASRDNVRNRVEAAVEKAFARADNEEEEAPARNQRASTPVPARSRANAVAATPTPSPRNVRSAQKSASRVRPIHECRECPYKTVDRRAIANHTKAHGRSAEYKCLLCSFSSSASAVAKHVQLHVAHNQAPPGAAAPPAPVAPTPEVTPRPSPRDRSHSQTPAPGNRRKQAAPARPGEMRNPMRCQVPNCAITVYRQEDMDAHILLHHSPPRVNDGASSSMIPPVNGVSPVPRPRQTAVVQPQVAAAVENGYGGSLAGRSGGAGLAAEPNSDHIPVRPRPNQSVGELLKLGGSSGQPSPVRGGNAFGLNNGLDAHKAFIARPPARRRNPRARGSRTVYGSRKLHPLNDVQPKPDNPSAPIDCVECGFPAKNWRSLISHRGQKHKRSSRPPTPMRSGPPTKVRQFEEEVPKDLADVDLNFLAISEPRGNGSSQSPEISVNYSPVRARSTEIPLARHYPQPGVIRYQGPIISREKTAVTSNGNADTDDWEDDGPAVPVLNASPRRPQLWLSGRSKTSFAPRRFYTANRDAGLERTVTGMEIGGEGSESEMEDGLRNGLPGLEA